MFRFEDLKVWHKAVELFAVIDTLADSLPGQSRFGLADQLRRAALSISSNIAEGAGRETVKEFQHFLTIAKGSLFEVVSIVSVCKERKFIEGIQYSHIYSRAEEISKMLTALRQRPARASALGARRPALGASDG